jgi:hypothetical protein
MGERATNAQKTNRPEEGAMEKPLANPRRMKITGG